MISASKASMECPSCALPLEGAPVQCPYCQYEYPRRTMKSRIIVVVAVLVAVVWLVDILVSAIR